MKEKLTRNIGLKILSIILAALLWLVITNVDDPIIKKPFYNVPVKILNEKAISSLGKVYDITEGETIDFTVAARRQIADNLSSSDFTVTADFSKLSEVNAVTINITCSRYGEEEVRVTDGLYQVMKVNLEDLVEKNFQVNVIQKGEPAEGYYVAKKEANTIIKVSGPRSKIERISQIVAEVDVTGVAGSFRSNETPKALDADGKEIDASNLKFSVNYVTINIGMYKTKEINLIINTTGKPAAGFVMTAMDYQPETIVVAGEDSALNSIQSLVVTENIDGANQDIKKGINLEDQLGEGLILVGDNQTATINVTIAPAETKEIMLQTGDINIKNKPTLLDLVYLTPGPIVLKLTGPVAVMDEVTVKSLKPYIDVTDYSNGTYDMPIDITLPENVTLDNSPQVSIFLMPKQ